MATTHLDPETAMKALEELERLIERQREKVLAVARRIRPSMSEDDLRNLHRFPEVTQDPAFEYEDGQLAGLRVARITLRARLLGAGVAQG